MMKEPTRERPQQETESYPSSQLLLLRVWTTQKNGTLGTEDLAGKVQDPVSGRVQFFSSAIELVRTLRRMITRKEGIGPGEEASADPS